MRMAVPQGADCAVAQLPTSIVRREYAESAIPQSVYEKTGFFGPRTKRLAKFFIFRPDSYCRGDRLRCNNLLSFPSKMAADGADAAAAGGAQRVEAAQLPKQAAGTAVSNRMHNPATTNVLILETAVPAAKSTNSRHQAILISADLFPFWWTRTATRTVDDWTLRPPHAYWL